MDVFLTRLSSGVADQVRGFHHLTGPRVDAFTCAWETLARPLFQRVQPRKRVIRLAGLVIFATYDKQFVRIIERTRDARVVIRVERVPPQRARNGALWHGKPDDIRAI